MFHREISLFTVSRMVQTTRERSPSEMQFFSHSQTPFDVSSGLQLALIKSSNHNIRSIRRRLLCGIKLKAKKPTRTDSALQCTNLGRIPTNLNRDLFVVKRHQGAMPHVCPNVRPSVRCLLSAEPPQIAAIKDGRGRKAIESLSSSVCACRVGSTSGCRHSSSLIRFPSLVQTVLFQRMRFEGCA